jgi:hypothetical protein
MQPLDIRYILLLLPLIYILTPYFLTGNFIILGGITVIAVITGMILFILIVNLNIGGSIQAIATGGSASAGMNSEGGYSLFVVFIGGLFYLGAQLAIFITPILTFFSLVINGILSFFNWIVSGSFSSTFQVSKISNLGLVNLNISQVYPTNLIIPIGGLNINVFEVLDFMMGSAFILGLYFMVASRGH